MTKGARKTGRIRRQGVPRRESIGRPVKTTILIVTESEATEPYYFRSLGRQDEVAARFAVAVKKAPHRSPEEVVQRALELKQAADTRQPYDEVCCVMDVEGTERRASLDKAIRLARRNTIEVFLSNPCFEVRLLAHFEKKSKSFKDANAVIAELRKHWKDYRKNDEHVYDRVSALTAAAIENARWVREKHHESTAPTADCNSSTDVYGLVQRLVQQFIAGPSSDDCGARAWRDRSAG